MAVKKEVAVEKTAAKKTTAKAAAKTTTTKKACATKKTVKAEAPILYFTAENAGFKAGDVYNSLVDGALTVAEIAKKANITEQEVILGAGWLLKEGKLASTEDGKLVLA